jgi:hypothetical protein
MNRGHFESSIGPDRLATRDEVRSAKSLSSPGGCRRGFSEMESDSSRCQSSLHQEIEWVMIVREMRDCTSN